jgi:hypothetical protein
MNNAYKWQLLTKGTFAGSLGCHFSTGLTVFGFLLMKALWDFSAFQPDDIMEKNTSKVHLVSHIYNVYVLRF